MRRIKKKKTTTRSYKKKTIVFSFSKKKKNPDPASPHKRGKTLRRKSKLKHAA